MVVIVQFCGAEQHESRKCESRKYSTVERLMSAGLQKVGEVLLYTVRQGEYLSANFL